VRKRDDASLIERFREVLLVASHQEVGFARVCALQEPIVVVVRGGFNPPRRGDRDSHFLDSFKQHPDSLRLAQKLGPGKNFAVFPEHVARETNRESP
jgi:hypothetical protein